MSQVERIKESIERQIELSHDQQSSYFFVIDGDTNCNLQFIADQAACETLIHVVVIAQPDHSCTAKVNVELQADNCKANVRIVTFLVDQGSAEVDGSVTIAPQTHGCSGHLLEENIILGNKVSIKTLPMLDVRSSDVEASHGAKIEKLNPQHLFYLGSKGIPPQTATQLMIEGYINELSHPFADHGEMLNIKKMILDRVLHDQSTTHGTTTV